MMSKRIFMSMATALMALALHAQNYTSAFGCDSDGPYTNIRNAPNGKVVDQIPTEDDTMFVLDTPTNGWWRIVGNGYSNVENQYIDLEGSTTGYWIHSSVVAVGTRNYGNEVLLLKASPSDDAKTVGRITEESLVHPIDVKGDWVKVKTFDGRQTGWIEEYWLCSNPVTTCP